MFPTFLTQAAIALIEGAASQPAPGAVERPYCPAEPVGSVDSEDSGKPDLGVALCTQGCTNRGGATKRAASAPTVISADTVRLGGHPLGHYFRSAEGCVGNDARAPLGSVSLG